ncbi:unnamed protein product [Somion occarium]|uniref:Uncharacterized protein n=1 Tax=Somion occarium TaxID=3059160 RepID=A0ABP1D128_9APHY
MSYSASTYPFSSTSYATPSAFGMFAAPQSPRETHFMVEDFRVALGSHNGQRTERKRTTSGSSMKAGLKKLFGGM